ncbi:MAG TPA: pitrilysin family protein [Caulobacteraceae bacterium]|jgi:zinc protease
MKHLMIGCVTVALSIATLVGAPLAAEAPASSIIVPPFTYTTRTLPNGMKLYEMRDPKSATVTVDIWYGVGSRDDPRGRSGFAHLFEHMMFRDTRDLTADQSDALIDDAGGARNAGTAQDYTAYTTTIPANHLERELWLEGERLSSLVIDRAGFDAERHTVEEELRQRIYNTPYGRILYELQPRTVYRDHPYALELAGSIADLDAATAEDARAFHEIFYRPDNATVVVSGNFDPADLDRWADRYLGKIPNPSQPLVKDRTPAPEGAVGRTVIAYAPNVPLPAIVHAWHAPRADDDDFAAMQILEVLLAKGPSSRLNRSLVHDQGLASRVYVTDMPALDGGVFAAVAILAPGKTLAETDAAFSAEMAGLRDQPVPADELERAKNRIMADALRARETADDRAEAFGAGAGGLGDPGWADRMLADVHAMTPEHLQQIVRRYLAQDRRIDIHYMDESQRASGPPETPLGQRAAVGGPVTAPRLTPIALLPEAERQRPPAPGPARPVAAPEISERVLANGLRVVVARSSDTPLVSMALEVGAGSAADPQDKVGLAAMTSALMLRGSVQHSAADLQDSVAGLGASLSARTDVDGAVISLSTPQVNVAEAAGLMAEAVRNPVFNPDEVERQRKQNVAELDEAMGQPVRVALRLVEPLLYGSGSYGRVTTDASLKSISRDEVAAWRLQRWRPDNAVLVITGALDDKTGFALAERLFGGWTRPADPLPAPPPASEAVSAGRVIVVDVAKTGQSAVFGLMPALARGDGVFTPLSVGNEILSKNIYQEVRQKRGLSYGGGAILVARRAGGHLEGVAQTKNESAAEVADLILGEFDKLNQNPIGADELRNRTALLAGGYEMKIETADGLAAAMADLAEAGVPPSEAAHYASEVLAATSSDVRTAARARLHPTTADVLIVGDAGKFLDALRKRHPNVEVFTLDELRADPGKIRKP